MFSTLFFNLPHLAYLESLELMRRLVDQKRRGPFPEVLILLEHEPVLTMGRRAESSDILVSEEVLSGEGITVHKVERGGLITYHGPGQLVAYPIFNLRTLGLTVIDLVNGLEEIVLNTLSDFNVAGKRNAGQRGVWVEREKIASIGVAVQGGISFHGLALNVDPNLHHFDLINPCGLNGVRMTSMQKLLGKQITTSDLRPVMAKHFARQFNLDLEESPSIGQPLGRQT
ncbi:MAG: lipoyl(octanoyl) transferase LipB [Deltaproteobacteria bacterium]|nr:lipoyl(octanoyl) transferase LipB [Deltaproteobacteria bacterium]